MINQNALVSILQFIVDTQWSLLFLVLVMVGIVWVRRMPPETRVAVRAALMARGIKASVGSVSVEVGAPANADTLVKAAATDDQLTKELEPSESGTTEEQVQQLRREAVEQVMREAAEWGWTMAKGGVSSLPLAEIQWNGDKPKITYTQPPVDPLVVHTLSTLARNRHRRLLNEPPDSAAGPKRATTAPAPRS